MDSIDQKLLRHLMQDGRITNNKLAKAVGLSESATLERVRRLEASKIIEGYTVQVNPTKVNRSLEVFMMFTLNNQSVKDVKAFETAMAELPEVLSCAQVLGRFDFIAHIAVSDIVALQGFINEKLIAIGSIERMETLTVLNMLKRNQPPLPLTDL